MTVPITVYKSTWVWGFQQKFSSALFRAWSVCHHSPVTRLAAAPPPEPSRHLLVTVGGLMSESTVYSLQSTVLSLRRSTNFIYPSWSPHLTSHQDNGSVVRFSKQAPLQIRSRRLLQVTRTRSDRGSPGAPCLKQPLARPHSAAVTRGHHQCRGGSQHFLRWSPLE